MNLLSAAWLGFSGWKIIRTNYVQGFWNKHFEPFFKGKYFKTIIDLGCGEGSYAIHLKQYASRVIGVDVDPLSVVISKGHYDKVIEANISNIILPRNCAVFCNQVIEHMTPKNGVRLLKQLRSKAKFAIICCPVDPFRRQEWRILAPWGKQHSHKSTWTPSVFNHYGFDVNIIGQCIVAVLDKKYY